MALKADCAPPWHADPPRCADGNPVVRQQVTPPSVIAILGGLPIKVGDEVIGVDAPCVQAGPDMVAEILK